MEEVVQYSEGYHSLEQDPKTQALCDQVRGSGEQQGAISGSFCHDE